MSTEQVKGCLRLVLIGAALVFVTPIVVAFLSVMLDHTPWAKLGPMLQVVIVLAGFTLPVLWWRRRARPVLPTALAPTRKRKHGHGLRSSQYKAGAEKITSSALDALRAGDGADLALLRQRVDSIATEHLIPAKEIPPLLVAAWERAVDVFLDDGVLDEQEERCLTAFKTHFTLDDAALDRHGTLTRTVKAATLRDLLAGKVPERMSITGDLPLNLQKSERVIWVFPNTEYLEDKTRRRYVGRSEGASIRIMKGVYYRVGAFKGHPVDYTERVSHGRGLLALTTKHLYYHGASKSFRIPYSKIVSFEPFANGVGVMRDAATAKPQTFVTGDGWFTYNVLANVNNIT